MIFPIVSILFSGIILMAVPLSVYRGVSIARPFSYKRIMTRNRVIVMIIALWIFAVITALPNLDYHLVFVPSLAACAVVEVDPVIAVIYLVPGVLSFLLILCAVFLAYPVCICLPALQDHQVKPICPWSAEKCFRQGEGP